MTLTLPDRVRELAPSRFNGRGTPSAIRIQTTRPVFLLFDTDARRPACVATIGSRETLQHLDHVLRVVHGRDPDLVPESLACVHWRGDEYLHVQNGLPGLPWFRLREHVRGGEWVAVESRAREALSRLHRAVADVAEWRVTVTPAAELRRVSEQLMADELSLPEDVSAAIARSLAELERVGEMQSFWQHGDFCLNNLVIAPDRARVIDFEEFGLTAMPLHDELSLALSFEEFRPAAGGWAGVLHRSEALIAPALARWPAVVGQLSGFVLHHLIWRINQCSGRPGRRAMRAHLARLLDDFVRL